MISGFCGYKVMREEVELFLNDPCMSLYFDFTKCLKRNLKNPLMEDVETCKIVTEHLPTFRSEIIVHYIYNDLGMIWNNTKEYAKLSCFKVYINIIIIIQCIIITLFSFHKTSYLQLFC